MTAALVALPLAASATLVVARWLPIRFEYTQNDLGIVSVASVQRYPIQQETFWVLFALAFASVVYWGVVRGLAARIVSNDRGIAAEALALGSLLVLLALPIGWGEILAVGLAVASALVVRSAAGPAAEPDVEQPPSAPPRRGAARAILWGLAATLLAVLLTSGIGVHVWNVANRVPDARIAVDNFKFLGETGQHLAWANALDHGWFQGRDVFCLYGPLYDLGLVGMWSVVGRSAAAWNLYWALTRVVGWLALFGLATAMVRHRVALLALPFLLPWVELRVGWALLAGWAISRWLDTGRRGFSALAGGLAGVGLLYSQEYGAAISIAAALGFAIRRDARAALAFAGGAVLAMAPLLVWYAANGALIPMLRDVVQYPAYMIAGYGKLPFPGLYEALPLALDELGSRASQTLRLGYAVPAVCLAGLLLALRVGDFDVRRPWASSGRMLRSLAADPQRLLWLLVAVFGLIAFRSAMGRASLHRTHAALPAVALLLCVGIDRTIELWKRSRPDRPLAAWRFAALAGCVALAGIFQSATPLTNVARSLNLNARLLQRGHLPIGDPQVERVTRWVQLNTEPAEKVLFLPNDGAYYYLTDRPNPIRFVMGHQIVGDRHRAEVLRDLREDPPRYIVWDHHALRVDDLSDELVFGDPILDFIATEYASARRFDDVEILRHRSRTDPALVPGW